MPTSIRVRRSQPNVSTKVLALSISAALVGVPLPVLATAYTVTNTLNSGAGSLRQAILDANASGAPAGVVGTANTINVTASGTINLADALPMVFSNLIINGNGIVVDGGSAHRCFFVSGLPTTPNGNPQAIAVTLQNMQLNHCKARGGDGGSAQISGGGGLGAGGALFVNTNASLMLSKVSFSDNAAQGGNSGADGANYYSGGGGMGGAGADGGGGLGGRGGSGVDAGGGGIGGDGGSGQTGGGGGGGFGGAYITALQGADIDSLDTSLSSAGCGVYGSLIPLVQPYVLSQIQPLLNNAVNSRIPKPYGPGCGETICPAP